MRTPPDRLAAAATSSSGLADDFESPAAHATGLPSEVPPRPPAELLRSISSVRARSHNNTASVDRPPSDFPRDDQVRNVCSSRPPRQAPSPDAGPPSVRDVEDPVCSHTSFERAGKSAGQKIATKPPSSPCTGLEHRRTRRCGVDGLLDRCANAFRAASSTRRLDNGYGAADRYTTTHPPGTGEPCL